MADKASDTRSVVVKFKLDSSSEPPYAMSGCEGTIYHVSDPQTTFHDWEPENIGTPVSGGAEFALLIEDAQNGSTTPPTSVANWVVTFIPRGDGNSIPGSPFSGKSSISGTGAVMFLNDFLLDLKNAKIQKRASNYSWDWTVAVQIVARDGETKCFVSDPQMDVDQLALTDEQREQLDRLLRKLTKAVAKPARGKPAKKQGGKRR